MLSELRSSRRIPAQLVGGNLVVLVLSSVLWMACGSAAPTGPEVLAENVWSRPAVAMGEMSGESSGGGTEMGHAEGGTGAVFMTLVNKGQEADRLTGAQTDGAEVVEIHETRMEGDVMKMQLLPDGLEIPAEGEVVLKPGGYHLMLIGLKQDLKVGDHLTMVLDFEKSDSMTVDAEVREMGN